MISGMLVLILAGTVAIALRTTDQTEIEKEYDTSGNKGKTTYYDENGNVIDVW